MKISISTPDKGITYEEMLRTASGVAASVNTSTAENIQTSSFADAMTQANAQLSSTTVSTDYNTMSSSAAQISTLIANSIKKEDYSNNYTSSVSDDLSTVTSYDSIFREAAETFGVSYKLLISMAKQESNFDAKATSKSGAMGIMQLMPITAKALGVTDAYNPYQNIMAGAKYISDKLTEFSGDVQMALAAYNQGSGAVNRAGGIPAAAKDYVDKIMELMNTDFRVPATNYVSAEATKEEIAADVEKLLSQFSEHDSYDRFVELLEEEL